MNPEDKWEKLKATSDPVEHQALVDCFFVERCHEVAREINSIGIKTIAGFTACNGFTHQTSYNKGNRNEQTSNTNRSES